MDTPQQMTGFATKLYKIQYPISWRLDTSRIMGTELLLFSPLESERDKFSENVNVAIQDLGGQNIDLEKYKQITEYQLAELATDSQVFESSIAKTDKEHYYKVSYAMTQGTFRIKITSVCFIKNDKAYLATFSAEFDKYDRYKNDGEGILRSFVLIK
ncbi:MAG: hypothetical protein H7246_11510 [Phycisphaerae bacterium]|nr:hypothetical protein [Saprospiraceae bacterium]